MGKNPASGCLNFSLLALTVGKVFADNLLNSFIVPADTTGKRRRPYQILQRIGVIGHRDFINPTDGELQRFRIDLQRIVVVLLVDHTLIDVIKDASDVVIEIIDADKA